MLQSILKIAAFDSAIFLTKTSNFFPVPGVSHPSSVAPRGGQFQLLLSQTKLAEKKKNSEQHGLIAYENSS